MNMVAIKKHELMTVSAFSEKIATGLYSMKMYVYMRSNFYKKNYFSKGCEDNDILLIRNQKIRFLKLRKNSSRMQCER